MQAGEHQSRVHGQIQCTVRTNRRRHMVSSPQRAMHGAGLKMAAGADPVTLYSQHPTRPMASRHAQPHDGRSLGRAAGSDPKSASKYHCWARSQIRYMIGDSGRSYVVGFGNTPPSHEHHRGASCPAETLLGSNNPVCDYSDYALTTPNPNVLYGALVGGARTLTLTPRVWPQLPETEASYSRRPLPVCAPFVYESAQPVTTNHELGPSFPTSRTVSLSGTQAIRNCALASGQAAALALVRRTEWCALLCQALARTTPIQTCAATTRRMRSQWTTMQASQVHSPCDVTYAPRLQSRCATSPPSSKVQERPWLQLYARVLHAMNLPIVKTGTASTWCPCLSACHDGATL